MPPTAERRDDQSQATPRAGRWLVDATAYARQTGRHEPAARVAREVPPRYWTGAQFRPVTSVLTTLRSWGWSQTQASEYADAHQLSMCTSSPTMWMDGGSATTLSADRAPPPIGIVGGDDFEDLLRIDIATSVVGRDDLEDFCGLDYPIVVLVEAIL